MGTGTSGAGQEVFGERGRACATSTGAWPACPRFLPAASPRLLVRFLPLPPVVPPPHLPTPPAQLSRPAGVREGEAASSCVLETPRRKRSPAFGWVGGDGGGGRSALALDAPPLSIPLFPRPQPRDRGRTGSQGPAHLAACAARLLCAAGAMAERGPSAGPCPVRAVSRPPSGESRGVGSPSRSNPLKVLGPQAELSS